MSFNTLILSLQTVKVLIGKFIGNSICFTNSHYNSVLSYHLLSFRKFYIHSAQEKSPKKCIEPSSCCRASFFFWSFNPKWAQKRIKGGTNLPSFHSVTVTVPSIGWGKGEGVPLPHPELEGVRLLDFISNCLCDSLPLSLCLSLSVSLSI